MSDVQECLRITKVRFNTDYDTDSDYCYYSDL